MPRIPKLDDPMPPAVATSPGETRRDRILFNLRTGSTLAAAAEAAGIAESALHEWIARGRGHDPRGRKTTRAFAEFAEQVTQARAQAEVTSLMRIQRAAAGGGTIKRQQHVVVDGKGQVITLEDEVAGDWRAAAWFLERAFPQAYGRRQALQVLPAGAEEVVGDADAHRLSAQVDRLAAERGFVPRALEPPELGADGAPIEDAEIVEEEQGG